MPKAKRNRTQARRFAVDLEPSTHPDKPALPEEVTFRVERLQASTGQLYQSQRSLVVQNPWLPDDNSHIGLDEDSSKNEAAIDMEYTEIVDDQSKKKGKQKQKGLASVSMLILLYTFCNIFQL